MNSPVVVVEDLPAGPATAAIACLSGPAGPRVALAIRSQRSGQVVFFGPDEDLREPRAHDDALDAALGYAEGLGFLFEDDRVSEAPAEAWELWEALLEAGSRVRRPPAPRPAAGPSRLPRREDGREPGRVAAGPPEASAPEELWLEEVLAPGPAVGGAVPLSKFRSAVAAPARPRERGAARATDPPLGRLRVSPDRGTP
jgi:hypothetical protein